MPYNKMTDYALVLNGSIVARYACTHRWEAEQYFSGLIVRGTLTLDEFHQCKIIREY